MAHSNGVNSTDRQRHNRHRPMAAIFACCATNMHACIQHAVRNVRSFVRSCAMRTGKHSPIPYRAASVSSELIKQTGPAITFMCSIPRCAHSNLPSQMTEPKTRRKKKINHRMEKDIGKKRINRLNSKSHKSISL